MAMMYWVKFEYRDDNHRAWANHGFPQTESNSECAEFHDGPCKSQPFAYECDTACEQTSPMQFRLNLKMVIQKFINRVKKK